MYFRQNKKIILQPGYDTSNELRPYKSTGCNYFHKPLFYQRLTYILYS